MFGRVRSDHGLVSLLKSRDGVPTTVNMQTGTADVRSYDDVAEIWAGRDLSTDEALSALFVRVVWMLQKADTQTMSCVHSSVSENHW
jgi:hypothetical protein